MLLNGSFKANSGMIQNISVVLRELQKYLTEVKLEWSRLLCFGYPNARSLLTNSMNLHHVNDGSKGPCIAYVNFIFPFIAFWNTFRN